MAANATKPNGSAPPTAADPLAGLAPTPETGLSSADAAARLAQFGRNELASKKQSKLKLIFKLVRYSWWARVMEAGVSERLAAQFPVRPPFPSPTFSPHS